MLYAKNIFNRMMGLGLLASVGFAAFLLVSAPALAATAPPLASVSTYGVVSSTSTNLAATTINGDYCCTTCGAPDPTVTGTYTTPCPPATGTDQAAARAFLLAQPCTSVGAIVDLSGIDVGSGPGVFPPGCYSSTGAMNISSTITLTGDGVYIFRPGGALNAAANSIVTLTNSACESDIYWAPDGATGIGANATFAGNIIEGAAAANDITIGSTVSFIGRALAFGHTVNMNNDTITVPTCAPFTTPTAPGAPTVGKGFIPPTIVEGGGVGGVSTLTIILSNPNATAATITSFTDNLPAGVQVAVTPNASNTCGATTFNPIAGATTLTMTDGSIPGGSPGTCTLTVDVVAPVFVVPGSFLNQINIGDLVTSNGNNTVPAVATLIVTPTPAGDVQPPTVGKVFIPVSVTLGQTSTLTITLSNPDTSSAATIATLTDTLPTNLIIANPANASSTCGGTLTAVAGTSTILLTGGTIPIATVGPPAVPGTCTVTVDVITLGPGAYINTLLPGGLVTDLGNNAAEAIATLTGNPAGPTTPIPTLNEWGMIIFMVLAGLGSVYYLRRQGRV